MDLHASNWQPPSLIRLLPVPWCNASKHLVHSEIGTPNVESILWHLTGSIAGIQIYIQRALTSSATQRERAMLTAQQQARCCYKWYTWIRSFWHLTDRILTAFHLPFPISAIRSYLSLTCFAVFQWNWGTFFYKQTGRLDLNLNKTLLGNAAGCVHCEKYQGDWSLSLSWTQVISAGTFCLDLISALRTSRHSRLVSLLNFLSQSSSVPLFAERYDIFQTGFNKTFCICHRNGDTKPGKLLTLFMWQASKALHNTTATIAWRASEKSSLDVLLLSAFVGLCHLSRLSPLLPLSHFLISSLVLLRALRCAVGVTLTGLRRILYPRCLCSTTTN